MRKNSLAFFARLFPHWQVSLVLLLFSALLLTFQYTAMAKLASLPPSLSYQSWQRFSSELAARNIGIDTFDFSLILGGVLLVASLVILEVRSFRVSLFMRYIFSEAKRSLFFFLACGFVSVRYYFAAGEMSWAGDAPQHLSYSFITSKALANGEWPIWTNALGAGSPYTQFYGFLFFYLAGILASVSGTFYPALKLLLATCHVASGLGAYAFISSLCHSRRAGFFAGLAFVLCFWHVQHVLVMGRLPLGLFYALLPWPFYFFERLRSTASWHHALAIGLALGLLAFTHPGYAFWATIMFAIYAVLRLALSRPKRSTIYAASVFALASGLLAGSYLTLAMWIERGSTGLHAGFYLRDAAVPSWWHLLVWSNYRFWLLPPPDGQFHWYGGYLGLSIVAAATWALFYTIYKRRYRWLALFVPLALSSLLVFAHDIPPFKVLPFVQAMPPVRYLLFISFFLSVCAGLGYHLFEIQMRRRGHRRAPLALFALLLVDLGPTTFQHLYPSGHSDPTGYEHALFTQLSKESQPYADTAEMPNYRFFWFAGQDHPYVVIGRTHFLTQIPTPHAPHPGDLRSVHEFTSALEHSFSETFASITAPNSLPAHPDFPLISAGLRMLNVRFVMATLGDNLLHRLHWKNSPLLASGRIVPYQPEHTSATERARAIIASTNLSPRSNRCEQILVRDIVDVDDLKTRPRVEVLSHQVWNSRVEIQVQTSTATYVRLAYSHSPNLAIFVDGQRSEAMKTAGHFIALQIAAGTHSIVLEPQLSPLRRALLAAHLLLWLTLPILWLAHRRRIS